MCIVVVTWILSDLVLAKVLLSVVVKSILHIFQDFEAEAEAQAMQNPPKPEDTSKPPPQQSPGQGADGEAEQGEPSEGGNQVSQHSHACYIYFVLTLVYLRNS